MANTSVVVLVLDDVGENLWGPNRTASFAGITPNMDAIYTGGVYFSRCYASPNCAPARAQALTGRMGARTGICTSLDGPGDTPQTQSYALCGAQWQLQSSETTIAHRLKAIGHLCGAFGKWHVNAPGSASDYDHPRTRGGFHEYRGWPFNIQPRNNPLAGTTPSNMSLGFNTNVGATSYGWGRIVNGALTPTGTPCLGDLTNSGASQFTPGWAPTVNVDDAIAYINANPGKKFFLWVAPQAPHTPLQWPPYALHSQTQNYPGGYSKSGAVFVHDYWADINGSVAIPVKPWVKANLQALDTEFGRLKAACPADTTFVIFGDNGTDNTNIGTDGSIIESPYTSSHQKNTMYEGGIRVPLAISAPFVASPGRTVDCPVVLTDLYETLSQAGGCNYESAKVHDSHLLMPYLTNPDCDALFGIVPDLRGWSMAAWLEPLVGPASFGVTTFTTRKYAVILDNDYKLIWDILANTHELYNLATDNYEATNLTASGTSSLTTWQKMIYNQLHNLVRSYVFHAERLPPPSFTAA